MRAKVVSIDSGTSFVDGEERLGLRIEDADRAFDRIRIRRGVIDTTHDLQLDDEIELTISRVEPDSIKMAADAAGKAKAKLSHATIPETRHES